MKKIRLICALLVLLAAASPAMGATITAQGSAEIAVTPDMFTVTANVSATEITVGRAQEQVSGVIASATQKLVELGVNQEDIVTENYSYYPQYDYSDAAGQPRLVGYQVNHSLKVTGRDLNMLDAVLGALTDSGMTETYNVFFDVSNRSELYGQALTLAIGAAGGKAQTMAGAAGLTITSVQSVQEDSSGGMMRYEGNRDMVKGSAAGGSGIRSGQVSVSAAVTVVYEAE